MKELNKLITYNNSFLAINNQTNVDALQRVQLFSIKEVRFHHKAPIKIFLNI